MKHCDVRSEHEPGRTVRTYGLDQSGEKVYSFNSLGYRGEEYDPSAPMKIAVVGCSFTFGTGLNIEETWSHKFRGHLADSLGVAVSDINLVNLGAGGQSNDYCARTIFRQASDTDFDLVVWHLTPVPRTEYFDEGVPSTVNPGSIDAARLDEEPSYKLGYYEYYNPEMGYLSLIKNILLTQSLLRDRGIRLVVVDGVSYTGNLDQMSHLGPFRAQLETAGLMRHNFFVMNPDRAADASHAGPRAHAALAIDLLGFYGRFMTGLGDGRGEQVEAHATHLEATDDSWAYCAAFAESHDADLATSHARAQQLVERWPDEPEARRWLDKIKTSIREVIDQRPDT